MQIIHDDQDINILKIGSLLLIFPCATGSNMDPYFFKKKLH